MFVDLLLSKHNHNMTTHMALMPMIVTLIHHYLCPVGHFVCGLVTLFTVIAHSFCIVELFIYCINNLHMYRTLYQARMYKIALKKALFHARRR